MKTEYKVSVIVPCYNAEKWIEDCLTSVSNQKYDNVELIVVDNESTDHSVEIVQGLKDKVDFTFSSAPNIYPDCWDEAREVGFKLSTGDYLLTICSDDYIHPDFIGNCVGFMSTFTTMPLAMQSPIRGVKDEHQHIPYFTPLQKHHYDNLEEFKNLCLIKCPVNTPSVLFHRSLYEEGLLKAKPETYGGAADYDLYCKLADNDIFIHPSNNWLGYYYRWHPEQATWNVLRSGANYDQKIQKYWMNKWET